MRKIISDFLLDRFSYTEEGLVYELFNLLEPIMDDNYERGFEDGYDCGYGKGRADEYNEEDC